MKRMEFRGKRIVSMLALSAGLIAVASAGQALADVTVVYSVTNSGGHGRPGGGGPGGGGPGGAAAAGRSDRGGGPGGQGGGPGGQGGSWRGGQGGGANTVTLYFKGANARQEDSRGHVTIFSGTDKAIYVLNADEKTYFIQPAPPSPPSGAPAPATVTIAKLDATVADNVKQIAGKQAAQYSVTGSMTMGRPGGGAPPPDENAPPPLKVTGNMWLSDSVKLPAVNDIATEWYVQAGRRYRN